MRRTDIEPMINPSKSDFMDPRYAYPEHNIEQAIEIAQTIFSALFLESKFLLEQAISIRDRWIEHRNEHIRDIHATYYHLHPYIYKRSKSFLYSFELKAFSPKATDIAKELGHTNTFRARHLTLSKTTYMTQIPQNVWNNKMQSWERALYNELEPHFAVLRRQNYFLSRHSVTLQNQYRNSLAHHSKTLQLLNDWRHEYYENHMPKV